ncbi:MAG: hypothetical protein H7Z75_02630, partial [Ferruginibacter sp.]|nr:hypothetical protein [Cytophagales bacterium]
GLELWKSDGTPEGTGLVADIYPGQVPSSYADRFGPFNLTSVDGVLFFTANDGVNGQELWKFDPRTTACSSTGTILREQWNGVGGNAVSDIPLNTTPASSSQLTSLEAPTNVSDNYGSRLRGYLCAPRTGSYVFWLASDDDGDLYLSTDENPANKQRIAYVENGWATPREWDKYPSQRSAVVRLVVGRKYYVEVLHKDSLGGDNLAVGWRTPSMAAGAAPVVVPGSVLSSFVPPAATACSATGTILREQWNNVPGNTIGAIPVNALPSSSGQLTSFEAPTNVGEAYGARLRGYLCVPQKGGYTFWLASDDHGELYLSTDENPANKRRIAYVENGWANPRQWGKYTRQQSEVIELAAGRRYYVEVLHKEGIGGDNLAVGWRTPAMTAGSAPVVIPGAVLSPFVPTVAAANCSASGTILREQWNGVGGNAVSDIPLNTDPAFSSQLTSLEAPTNVGDNYGSRLRGYLCAPETGGYLFWLASDDDGDLYLSTDENPANKRRIAYVDNGWATPREWDKYASQQSAFIELVAGRRYYVEVLHKDSLGGDNLAVGWRTPSMAINAAPAVVPGAVLSPFLVQPPCSASGSLLRELWTGAPGRDLTDIPFYLPPTSTSRPTAFEGPLNAGDNYGARYRGYLCAPESGVYTFWIASDDNGELALSSDEYPANKRVIAGLQGFTEYRQWDKYAGQRASVRLERGQRYYIEALHKEAAGGDHFSVGWRLPSSPVGAAPVIVPGSVLSPFTVASARQARTEPVERASLERASLELVAVPNPFEGRVQVRFVPRETGPATLELHDLRGGRVRTLFEGAVMAGEARQVEADGRGLAEGLYLLRLRNGSQSAHLKLLHHR